MLWRRKVLCFVCIGCSLHLREDAAHSGFFSASQEGILNSFRYSVLAEFCRCHADSCISPAGNHIVRGRKKCRSVFRVLSRAGKRNTKTERHFNFYLCASSRNDGKMREHSSRGQGPLALARSSCASWPPSGGISPGGGSTR